MDFLSRLFAESAIRIQQGSARASKGKVTRRLLDEISDIAGETGITEGEIWINPLGRVTFSNVIPEEFHQRIRNVVFAEH